MKTPLVKLRPSAIGAIGHVVANFPSAAAVKSMVRVMVDAGVALIEVQIPFSEPSADGPVLMAANHHVLARGDGVDDSFRLMKDLTKSFSIPFVFMTYLNPVYQMGFETFVKRSIAAGARGVIIPDLPLDRAEGWLPIAQGMEFWVVPVVSPNMNDQRLRLILTLGSGFIYAVARQGVTGSKTLMGLDQVAFLQRIAGARGDLPIAMGFGLTGVRDLAPIKGWADYGIVGSHGLRTFQEGGVTRYRKLWAQFKSLI